MLLHSIAFMVVLVFRDSLLSQLSSIEKGNFDEILARLDSAGNTLDYKKYGDSLFETLITGGILGKYRTKWKSS